MNNEELIKYINSIPTFPDDVDTLTDSSKEYFINIIETTGLEDSQLIMFLEDLVESNNIELSFKRKYADTVYDPNVSFYLEIQSYIAKEIIVFLINTRQRTNSSSIN